MEPKLEWENALAYKWCEEYGDEEHRKRHHDDGSSFSPYCGNCRDGLGYIKDVVKSIKERF